MKKLYTLFFALMIGNFIFSQGCLPNGIAFSDQEQIDNFQINYPGCTEILGAVNISGYNIANLDGLSSLTAIGGKLVIGYNHYLTNISGLEKLISVGGSFKIDNNDKLTNLSGLDSLKYIGGKLSIKFNDILQNIMALESLESIGGQLYIDHNNSLINLSGLIGLTSINGTLTITNNPSLNDISGIKNIDAEPITTLYIMYNPLLSDCAIKSICDYLAGGIVAANFHNNAEGCKNQDQVETACQNLSVPSFYQTAFLSIGPNPTSHQITIILSTFSDNVYFSISQINGRKLSERRILEKETHIDFSNYPKGIYLVTFQAGNEVITKKVVKL